MHFNQKISIQLVEVLDNAPPNNEKEVSHQKLQEYSELREPIRTRENLLSTDLVNTDAGYSKIEQSIRAREKHYPLF